MFPRLTIDGVSINKITREGYGYAQNVAYLLFPTVPNIKEQWNDHDVVDDVEEFIKRLARFTGTRPRDIWKRITFLDVIDDKGKEEEEEEVIVEVEEVDESSLSSSPLQAAGGGIALQQNALALSSLARIGKLYSNDSERALLVQAAMPFVNAILRAAPQEEGERALTIGERAEQLGIPVQSPASTGKEATRLYRERYGKNPPKRMGRDYVMNVYPESTLAKTVDRAIKRQKQ